MYKGETGNKSEKQRNTNSTNTNTGTTTNTKRGDSGGDKGKSDSNIYKETLVESPKPNYAPIEIGGETTSNEIAKPKRKYKKRKSKKEDEKNSSEDIQKLLEGVFSVVSLKAGSHWQLRPEESKQIADPLSNILEKHNLLEKAESMSDGVALIVACISIVLPRILISRMNKPKKIKEVMKNNGAITTKHTESKSVESEEGQESIRKKGSNDDGNIKSRIESTLGEHVNALSPQLYG